jgi:hypothetical protein
MTTEKKMHGVYSIREYTVDRQVRSEWTKVGVAFPHKSGTGFNIDLHAVPLDGKLTIFPFKEKKEGDAGPEQPDTSAQQ